VKPRKWPAIPYLWPVGVRPDPDPQWWKAVAAPIPGVQIGADNYDAIMRHFDSNRVGVIPPGGPYFVDHPLRLPTNAVLLGSGGFTTCQLYRRRNVTILDMPNEEHKVVIRGISFMDNKANPAGDRPLVRLGSIYMSTLSDNFYVGSGGDGLVVGGGRGLATANDVIISRDYAWGNRGRGVVLDEVAHVHLHNVRSEYNGGGNLDITTPSEHPYSQWGQVIFDGGRLEGYHVSPWNARIRGRRVIARDSHISGGDVIILPGSIECDWEINQYADATVREQ
jgi:hypothetical protein